MITKESIIKESGTLEEKVIYLKKCPECGSPHIWLKCSSLNELIIHCAECDYADSVSSAYIKLTNGHIETVLGEE